MCIFPPNKQDLAACLMAPGFGSYTSKRDHFDGRPTLHVLHVFVSREWVFGGD